MDSPARKGPHPLHVEGWLLRHDLGRRSLACVPAAHAIWGVLHALHRVLLLLRLGHALRLTLLEGLLPCWLSLHGLPHGSTLSCKLCLVHMGHEPVLLLLLGWGMRALRQVQVRLPLLHLLLPLMLLLLLLLLLLLSLHG